MKIALFTPTEIVGEGVREEYHSEDAEYVLGLSEVLSKNGHSVSIIGLKDENSLNQNRFFYKDFVEVFLLPHTKNNFMLASMIHEFLLGCPHDVIEANQRRNPLIVEQLIGGTPTVVRSSRDIVDALSTGEEDFSRGPESSIPECDFFPVLKKNLIWSQHLSEIHSIRNSEAIICSDMKQLERCSSMNQFVYHVPVGIRRTGVAVRPNIEGLSILFVVNGRSNLSNGLDIIKRITPTLPESIMVNVLVENGFRDEAVVSQLIDCHAFTEVLERDEVDLWAIYSQSLCAVFPSKNESSKSQLLESIAEGCPVICFEQEDPDKKNWPLSRIGDWRSPQLPAAFKGAFDYAVKNWETNTTRDSLITFASTFLWSNLVESYVKVYTDAVRRSILRGKTRGL